MFTRGSTGFVHDKTTSLFPGAAASVGAVGFLPIETVSLNDIDSESFGELFCVVICSTKLKCDSVFSIGDILLYSNNLYIDAYAE